MDGQTVKAPSDPVLRGKLLAIPEDAWMEACGHFWSMSPKEMTARSLQEDVRKRLHWVKTPNRQSVGRVAAMVQDLLDVAAAHLHDDGHIRDAETPATNDGWRELLDGIAEHICSDYARFCVLLAPDDLEWSPPQPKEQVELSHTSSDDPASDPHDAAASSAIDGPRTSAELGVRLDQLRTLGARVLEALDSSRSAVEDAQPVGADLVLLCTAWDAELRAFAVSLHGQETYVRSFDALGDAVDAIRTREQSQEAAALLLAERLDKLEKFKQRRDDGLYTEDREFRDFVESKISELEREIADSQALVETEPPSEVDEGRHDHEARQADAPTEVSRSRIDISHVVEPEEPTASAGFDEDLITQPEVGASQSESEPESQPEPEPDFVEPEVGASQSEPEPEPQQQPEPAAGPVTDLSSGYTADRAPEVSIGPSVSELTPEALRTGLAQLIDQDRWAALSVVVNVTDLDAELVQALDLCAEAFSLPIAATDPSELLSRSAGDISNGMQSDGPTVALANVVAVLRTCLQFGRDHSWLLTEQSFDALPSGWREVGRHLHSAILNGYQHRWDEATSVHAATPLSDFKARAVDLRDTLPNRGNKLPRAGNVLRQLMLPGAELAVALDTVEKWTDGAASADDLKERRSDLSDPRKIVDRTDTSLGGAKQKRIQYGAYDKLAACIGEVVALLDHAILVSESTAKRNSVSQPRSDDIHTLLQDLPPVDVDDPLATAILGRFRRWLVSGDEQATEASRTFAEIKLLASLPATSAVRDEQRNLPEVSDVPLAVLLAELATPASSSDLFRTYLRVGNLPAAAVVDGQAENPLEYRAAQRDWESRILTRVIELQAILLRLHAQTQLDPVDRGALDGRIAALSQSADDRFDVIWRRAASVEANLKSLWVTAREELTGSLRELDLNVGLRDADRDRIRALIDQDDFVTAREFIAILTHDASRELPRAYDDGLVALRNFRDLQVGLPRHPANVLQVVEETLGSPPRDDVATALRAWNQGERARKPAEWARLLPSILNLLGLRKIPDIAIVDRTERNQPVGKFIVKAVPAGESYVAALGTRTRRKGYTVWTVPNGVSLDAMIEKMPAGERRAANIILRPGVVNWDVRQQFRRLTEKHKVTALLVDSATVVHMAIQEESTFRGLQRVALPFSTFAHWAPRVAGDVPDELFVGRVDLIDRIVSPEGSIFVYGGRQLGKSALLHRIEREYNRLNGRLAFYIDFKVERIGEENEPEHLWTVLRNRLQDKGIIPLVNTSTKPEAITKAIKDWLEADPERAMLLLCDESDAFLQNEARERLVSNRATSFPNVTVLKGLMDVTHRRFKPIFAGLHQVQRIADIPNSPLAHGGADILVGPLNGSEAWDLVVRPFKALGFEFESIDLVWRLLAFTNYQAGLVQIVCDELYRYMRQRSPGADEPPYVIRAADVDSVITNKAVRDFIAERFRLTIQLEDRYFVIAMVVAWLGLDSGFENRYTLREILEFCRDWWSGGFGTLTEREFAVYLDEMVGLGVLITGDDLHYGMRSPNVVHMLGDLSTIERQLSEGKFDLPLQYNARVSRRRLSEVRGIETYSPLSEYELSLVMPKRAANRTQYTVAVIGSVALGMAAVRDLLTLAAAEDYEYGIKIVSPDDAGTFLTSATGVIANRPLVVCDAVDSPDALDEVVGRLRTVQVNKIGRRAVLLGPFGAAASDELKTAGVEVVPLLPWSTETVRATIDNPITDPTQREKFVDATGGWPSLCERYLNEIRTGVLAVADAIKAAAQFPADDAEARTFLGDVGLSPDDTALLIEWASLAGAGEPVDVETLSEYFGVKVDFVSSFVSRLTLLAVVGEHADGYVLNNVVHRSLLAVSASDVD